MIFLITISAMFRTWKIQVKEKNAKEIHFFKFRFDRKYKEKNIKKIRRK